MSYNNGNTPSDATSLLAIAPCVGVETTTSRSCSPNAAVVSATPPPPPQPAHSSSSSSLRVRFRMITHQSSYHQVKARISSNTNLSHSPSSSSDSRCIYSSANNMLTAAGGSGVQLDQHPTTGESLCLYDSTSKQNTQTTTTQTTTTTVKTFRLTEDRNIRFDVTLKPTYRIRDNRLNATCSNSATNSREGFDRSAAAAASGYCPSLSGVSCNQAPPTPPPPSQQPPHQQRQPQRQQIVTSLCVRSSSCDQRRTAKSSSNGSWLPPPAPAIPNVRLRIRKDGHDLIELPIGTQ